MRFVTILTLSSSVVAICTLAGCDRKAEVAKTDEIEIKPTVHVPPPVQHYEGTPYWQEASKSWPPLMEFTVNKDGDHLHDSLSLRLTGTIIQSFIDGPKSDKHPLMCWLELTVRPIPRQLVGYSFNLDSVVFFDPVKKQVIPSLPMLSAERHTDKGVVRTMFSNNLAIVRSPELVDGQPLEPTVYITSVDKKVMKVSMPPLMLTFLMELPTDPIPIDSLKWGPL